MYKAQTAEAWPEKLRAQFLADYVFWLLELEKRRIFNVKASHSQLS
jgi:hypothetical protein